MVASGAAALFVILFLLEVFGYLTNPYIGLLVFVAVPLAFALGLLLIPAGMWWAHRRSLKHPGEGYWPVLDSGNPRHRRIVTAVVLLTLVNVLIVSLAAYGGVHYMESTSFCGTVCHTPMEPQYVAYQDAPHSRVGCVSCHVGSGAGNFVRAKASGTRQLWQVITGAYARPIPAPVHNMVPARETCAQCHWPSKYHGDRPRTIVEYGEDEESTENVTTFVTHVGGGSESLGRADGVHWHMNLANRVEYIATDPQRATIPYVRLTKADGTVTEFVADGAGPAPAGGEWREMDCIDCHNQAAHSFDATPQRAVDKAIAAGRLPRALPFARREAVAAVSEEYPDRQAAMAGIATRLRDFYAANAAEADRQLVEQAIRATQGVYGKNVFPSMKVTWGTYPNHLGHVDSPGCFRCHTDEHRSKDGRVIRQDCALCHTEPE